MAHHPSVGGVVGEVDAAPGTLGNIAALGTQQLTAAAPAVQKQDALLPRRQIPLQLLPKRAADTAEIAVPQFPAHIRQNDLRQTALIEALRQAAEAVIPLAGVIGRLHRGGGGAQHQTGSLLYAAVFGNIPCVVARGFFRFVGALLLLVQYDEAQPLQRGKYRRAGPQHHRGLAPADALILVPPFRQPQAAVQQRHLSAEVGGEPSHHLGGQGDLRHQDHHGLSLLQQGLCQTDIHQRLAAAGDALQKRHPGPARLRLAEDGVIGRLLLLVQGDLLRRDTVLPWGDAVLLPAAEGDEALLLQTAEGLAGSAGEIAQVVNRGLAALGQKRRRRRTGAVPCGACAPCASAPPPADGKRRELHHAVAHAAAALRAGGDKPLLLHLPQQRRGVGNGLRQRLQLLLAPAQKRVERLFLLRKRILARVVRELPELAVAVPDARGQDRADGVIKRAEIALAHPERQTDLPLGADRLRLQQLRMALRGFSGVLLPQGEDHALGGAVAPPEGYRDPACPRRAPYPAGTR